MKGKPQNIQMRVRDAKAICTSASTSDDFQFVNVIFRAVPVQPVCNRRPMGDCYKYKADKFDACVMTRSVSGLDISFARAQDGLLLFLESSKWRLDRGKAYAVRLVAGSQSVEAKALAEAKDVSIALTDRQFNGKLRSATVLEVRAEGATLRVPLDRSSAAFERLETCFEKNSREGVETNPFVAPDRKP
jgi:hypothetical protein